MTSDNRLHSELSPQSGGPTSTTKDAGEANRSVLEAGKAAIIYSVPVEFVLKLAEDRLVYSEKRDGFVFVDDLQVEQHLASLGSMKPVVSHFPELKAVENEGAGSPFRFRINIPPPAVRVRKTKRTDKLLPEEKLERQRLRAEERERKRALRASERKLKALEKKKLRAEEKKKLNAWRRSRRGISDEIVGIEAAAEHVGKSEEQIRLRIELGSLQPRLLSTGVLVFFRAELDAIRDDPDVKERIPDAGYGRIWRNAVFEKYFIEGEELARLVSSGILTEIVSSHGTSVEEQPIAARYLTRKMWEEWLQTDKVAPLVPAIVASGVPHQTVSIIRGYEGLQVITLGGVEYAPTEQLKPCIDFELRERYVAERVARRILLSSAEDFASLIVRHHVRTVARRTSTRYHLKDIYAARNGLSKKREISESLPVCYIVNRLKLNFSERIALLSDLSARFFTRGPYSWLGRPGILQLRPVWPAEYHLLQRVKARNRMTYASLLVYHRAERIRARWGRREYNFEERDTLLVGIQRLMGERLEQRDGVLSLSETAEVLGGEEQIQRLVRSGNLAVVDAENVPTYWKSEVEALAHFQVTMKKRD